MIRKRPFLALGGLVTAIGLIATGAGFAICLINHDAHIKIKMYTFMVLPNVIMGGVTLLVFDALIQLWKRKRNGLKVIDVEAVMKRMLQLKRWQVAGILVLAIVGLGSSALFGNSAYHFTESQEFCGTLCHEPMGAQYAAFKDSPHASIRCVDCHVGPTIIHFAQAKISGMHQLQQVAMDNFPRPIYAPLKKIPPADLTCKRCHWQDMHWGDYMHQEARYGYDTQNSKRYLQLQVHAGGNSHSGGGIPGGVHHHMQSSDVRFLTPDKKRKEIAMIQVTKDTGETVIYDLHKSGERKYTDEELAKFQEVKVDCLGCHNRPAHRFEPPDEAIDVAIARGKIDRTLPFAKKAAMEALTASYPSKEAAGPGIEKHVKDFYASHFGDLAEKRQESITRMTTTLQAIYERNIFPHMNLDWNQYPTHTGHRYSEGCLRCHSKHFKRRDTGEAIEHDCSVCHLFFKKSRTDASLMEATETNSIVHPFKHGKKMKTHIDCWECHATKTPYAMCGDCHEKETQAPVMGFECSSCHKPGEEKVTDKDCQACHPAAKSELHKLPENADCMKCHKPHVWKVGNERTFCPACRNKPDATGEGCDYCARFKGIDSLMSGLKVLEPIRIPTYPNRKKVEAVTPDEDDTTTPEADKDEPKTDEAPAPAPEH